MPLKEFKAKLIPEIKELNVYARKNLLSSAMAGEIMSTLKGRGIEFEDYRDYTVKDDAARIDWRASKRAQRILVREYKLEINFNVFFLIDVSESMLFASTTNKLKCEYAAELITSLYSGILRTGNSIGFGLFNEALFEIVKPALGRKQFYMFTKVISTAANYGGEKNLAKAFQQTLSILDKRALIFIVSDFLTPDDNWIDLLKILAERHEVIGLMIRDPRDMHIPKDTGQLILQDPYSNEKIYIDSNQYYNIYEEFNVKQLNLLRSMFKHYKSDLLELSTDKPFLDPILKFFRKRGGRWR